MRPIEALDHVAHFLYCPTLRGDASRARWHHRVHLIPGSLLAWVCDAYDRSLGVTEAEMHLRRPTRVEIDPNIRVGRDRTIVGIEDPEFPVTVGEEVEVYTEDWLVGSAVVDSIDPESALIVLRLEWSELRIGPFPGDEEADTTEEEFDAMAESAEDVAAIFDAGEKGLTAPPVYALACPDGCTRLEASAPFVGGKATGACGEEMRPAPVTRSTATASKVRHIP